MPILRINEFPEGSGSLSTDDVFLFMDDPSGSGVTKKISLSEISNAIGGGGGGGNPFDQNLNTTDFPTFSGVNLSNNSSLAQGSFDSGIGGNGGISLNCVIGYELNWQASHLRNIVTGDSSGTPQVIYIDSAIQFPGSGLNYLSIDSSGITFPDGSAQTFVRTNLPIVSLGSISGSNTINSGIENTIQLLTLNGSGVTLTKGSGWPATSSTNTDTTLRITVNSPTTITWTLVTQWFNQAPAGPLSSGTHLFLLRGIGNSIVEGHYIGKDS